MSFSSAIRTCFRKYATFSGRASRPEYWWFFLFLVLGSAASSAIDAALFGTRVVETGPGMTQVQTRGPLNPIFTLGTLIPALAVGWRRMHDTGRSGLFLLYPFIVTLGLGSFIGFVAGFEPLLSGDISALVTGVSGLVIAVAMIVLILSPLLVIWWLTRPSQPGANRFGPAPSGVPA
ncbi:MAG: DUF805 domain-containing protein [Paracoccaceae bacterium]